MRTMPIKNKEYRVRFNPDVTGTNFYIEEFDNQQEAENSLSAMMKYHQFLLKNALLNDAIHPVGMVDKLTMGKWVEVDADGIPLF